MASSLKTDTSALEKRLTTLEERSNDVNERLSDDAIQRCLTKGGEANVYIQNISDEGKLLTVYGNPVGTCEIGKDTYKIGRWWRWNYQSDETYKPSF